MTAVDIAIEPMHRDTWDAIPEDTVAALDLLALTLTDLSGWRVTVQLRNGITLTASPAPTTDGEPE